MTSRNDDVTTYTLTYDAENRLTGVSGGATASFVYDGDGQRVKATFGTSTIAYVGDYFEWKGSTSTMVKYYYAGGQRVAMRVGSSTVYYLLTDHLGSTAITANGSGNRVAELRYKAWGETRYTWGATPTAYKFTGQRLDDSTGLYYYGARYYDAVLGRFVQADPTVPEPTDPQLLNRFSYVANNPLKYIDPSGLDLFIVTGHGEGDTIWDNPEVLDRLLKEWIMTYKGWNENQWSEFLAAWGDPSVNRDALMQQHKVFIFNWNDWQGGRTTGGASTGINADWAIDEVYRDIEKFGMKDITLIGHSKGATVVHGFLQKMNSFEFLCGERPEKAVLIGTPSFSLNRFMGASFTPSAIPADVMAVQIYDRFDTVETLGNSKVPGAWLLPDTIDEGGTLGHHDWKRHQAVPVLRTALQVQGDRGAVR